MDRVDRTHLVQPPYIGHLVLGRQRKFGHVVALGLLRQRELLALDAR